MQSIHKVWLTGLLILSGLTSATDTVKTVSYSVDYPKSISVGRAIDIKVNLKIKEGWHIYAQNGANAAQGYIESYIKLTPPDGFKVGPVQTPEPVNYGNAQIYEGVTTVMSQKLIPKEGIEAGSYRVKGIIFYQACNAEYCEPPRSETITLDITLF